MDPTTSMYVAQGIHGIAYGGLLYSRSNFNKWPGFGRHLREAGNRFSSIIFGVAKMLNMAHTK